MNSSYTKEFPEANFTPIIEEGSFISIGTNNTN